MRICLLSDTGERSHVASSVVMVCAGRSSNQCAVTGLTSMCRKRRARSVWCAHAQSARSVRARTLNRRAAVLFHVDTCIFPRDKTGLTMGKPEVNLTFIRLLSDGPCKTFWLPAIFCAYNSYLSYEYNKTVVLLPVCGGRKNFGSRRFFSRSRLRKESVNAFLF